MTPDQIEAERVRFEAWMRTYRYQCGLMRISDSYVSTSTFFAWEGWLARAEQAHGATRELPQN